MPWQKGLSRKGYVKADGTPHAPKPTKAVVTRKTAAGTAYTVDIDIASTLPDHHHARENIHSCWRCRWYFRYGTPFKQGDDPRDAAHRGR